MVVGVSSPPVVVREECERTDTVPDERSGTPRLEERPMPEVVLDHEESYEKSAGGNREKEGEEVAHLQASEHDIPETEESCGRNYELTNAAKGVSPLKGSQHRIEVTYSNAGGTQFVQMIPAEKGILWLPTGRA